MSGNAWGYCKWLPRQLESFSQRAGKGEKKQRGGGVAAGVRLGELAGQRENLLAKPAVAPENW